jgi:hypothetical protein
MYYSETGADCQCGKPSALRRGSDGTWVRVTRAAENMIFVGATDSKAAVCVVYDGHYSAAAFARRRSLGWAGSQMDLRRTVFGGIDEMANLQDEFKIFKPKRPFSESAALLGLGGLHNARAKNRWLDLLRNLPDNGDQKIADALVANFKRKQPLPCYMRAHDLRTKGENKVVIAESDDPLLEVIGEQGRELFEPLGIKPPDLLNSGARVLVQRHHL